jgi:hypothetical protein
MAHILLLVEVTLDKALYLLRRFANRQRENDGRDRDLTGLETEPEAAD